MSIVLRSRLVQAKASSLQFCRPTPAERPPSGPGWLHEIKQDGFRMMVRREGESCTAPDKERLQLVSPLSRHRGGCRWP